MEKLAAVFKLLCQVVDLQRNGDKGISKEDSLFSQAADEEDTVENEVVEAAKGRALCDFWGGINMTFGWVISSGRRTLGEH